MKSYYFKSIILIAALFANIGLHAQVRVVAEQPIIPVLIDKPYNPVLR